jgi:protein tyrosine phosphatase (PTP) superfamily phosphohydrolase (DUF442 family)
MSDGLVDTMIRKMEGTFNQSGIIRNMIVNLNSTDDIFYKKSQIIEYLYNIEDDILEYIKFTKSLNIITNDLQEDCENLRNTCELNEYKINTMEEAQFMLRENIREFVEQLHQCEERISKNETYIRQLEDSLTEAEQIIKKINNEKAEINNFEDNYTKALKYDYDNVGYSCNNKYDNSTYEYTNTNDLYNYNDNTSNNKYNTISYETSNDYGSMSTKDVKYLYNEYDNYGSMSDRNKVNEQYNTSPQPEKLNDYRDIKKYEETNIYNNTEQGNNICDTKIDEKYDETNSNTKREGQIEDIVSNNDQINVNEKESISKDKKTKGQKIVDIVMKINSNDAINAILRNMYGEDILDRIVSSDTDNEIIAEIEEVIRGVEKLIENEKNDKLIKNKQSKDIIEERPEEEEQSNPKTGRIIKRNKSYISVHSIKSDEPKFEESLRKSHYPCNNIKIYNPYLKPYGSYFDPSLMKGGPTSITSPRSSRSRKGHSARKNKN